MSLIIKDLPLYWRLKSTDDLNPGIPETFDFSLGFSTEGLLLQNRYKELLDLLEKIYSLDYNIGYIQEGYEIALPYVEDFWNYLLTISRSFTRKLRILEVGCGGATLLKRFKDLGHQVVGIDPSPLSERKGEEYKIHIEKSLLKKDLDIGNFDLIYSMDVLEHAFNPVEFIDTSIQYLHKGGKLVASVPDAGPSIKMADVSLAMHQHLQYFDSTSLRNLFLNAGLMHVVVKRSGYGGSIYVQGEKSHNLSKSLIKIGPDNNRLENTLNLMQKNYLHIQELIIEHINKKKTVAIYAPLRALPYLAELPKNVIDSQIRFIDDTQHWHDRRFDGVDIKVENIVDLSNNPSDLVMLFSLTFENKLRDKLKSYSVHSPVLSLSQMLELS